MNSKEIAIFENLKSIDNGGKAYKMVNPKNSNEYIVLQSIQKGPWNQGWEMVLMVKAYLPIAFHIRLTK